MSNFYQGLLFLHGHIADPRVISGEAAKPTAEPQPQVAPRVAAEPKWKWKPSPRRRSLGGTPRAA